MYKVIKNLYNSRIEGNPNLCANGDSCMVTPTSTKKKISTTLIVILCIVAVVLLVVIVMFWRLRKRQGKFFSYSKSLVFVPRQL